MATSVWKLGESERERRWEDFSVFVYAYYVRERQPNPPYHSLSLARADRFQAGLNPLSVISLWFLDRGNFRPLPLTRMKPHTTKHGVSVYPHFLASISRCRVLRQDRELCFSRLRVKKARSRRQIKNDKMYY